MIGDRISNNSRSLHVIVAGIFDLSETFGDVIANLEQALARVCQLVLLGQTRVWVVQ